MRTDKDFFAVLDQYMEYIQVFHKRHADKKPIMELSLPSRKIYAYPYAEYMKTLSKKSREMLRKEYRAAIKHNKMVVFVRDTEARVLKSCSIPIEEIEYAESEIPE